MLFINNYYLIQITVGPLMNTSKENLKYVWSALCCLRNQICEQVTKLNTTNLLGMLGTKIDMSSWKRGL